MITYYTSFEERCLKTTRDASSHHEETIQSTIDRLWDQRDIFSDCHYIHTEQKGSASLKEVLMALTETGYEDLGVQEGMEAVIAYEEMTDSSTSQSQRKDRRNQLLIYCKRYTRQRWRFIGLFVTFPSNRKPWGQVGLLNDSLENLNAPQLLGANLE